MVVLERLDHAIQRNAQMIYAEVTSILTKQYLNREGCSSRSVAMEQVVTAIISHIHIPLVLEQLLP